jgi:hypothetical protein
VTVQALLGPHTRGFHLLPPGRPMFEHRIHDRQQLPHAGHQCQFVRFAEGTQVLIEATNDRIEAGGHNRGHIEGRPPTLLASTPDRSLPSKRAAISIERRHPNEGHDLFVRQGAQLWQIQHGMDRHNIQGYFTRREKRSQAALRWAGVHGGVE